MFWSHFLRLKPTQANLHEKYYIKQQKMAIKYKTKTYVSLMANSFVYDSTRKWLFMNARRYFIVNFTTKEKMIHTNAILKVKTIFCSK
ncbi:MAG: hypothetical protein ACKPKO_49915, partial [Candidatus Fonsibacter sp.]